MSDAPCLIGVDDDLVDELDDLVVGCGRRDVLVAVVDLLVLHAREQVADVGIVLGRSLRGAGAAEKQVERRHEFARAADLVDDLAFRVNVVDDPRAADFFRIGGQHDDAFGRIVDRHPHAALDELAAHVLEQIDRLDAVCLERLVGHAEVCRQRVADRRQLDLEFIDQHGFDVEVLAARRPRGEIEFLGGNHRIGDQMIVLALDRRGRLLTLLVGDRQRLAQMHRTLLHRRREGLPGLGIDDLHDADQLLALRVDDGRHQHLLGAVTGLDVDLLQEIEDAGCTPSAPFRRRRRGC